TKSNRDWISDVCSSELREFQRVPPRKLLCRLPSYRNPPRLFLPLNLSPPRPKSQTRCRHKPLRCILAWTGISPDIPSRLTAISQIGRASCRERGYLSCY